VQSVRDLYARIFTKDRLTVSLTGDAEPNLAKSIIEIFPTEGKLPEKSPTPPCAEKHEFFLVPSKVAYAVIGGRSDRVRENLGKLRVARSILSYEYLWNTVRVKSGAYGTGFVHRRDGGISFYSYRDPSPAGSIQFYKESSSYLRSLSAEGEELTKFIIGAIGEYDVLTTPRTSAMLATRSFISGWTAEDEDKVRRDMLTMRTEDLILCADIIDEALSDYSQAVVGGREHLDSLSDASVKIYEI
jgi:Zn-dependent M16 (insulinase) family peptidase